MNEFTVDEQAVLIERMSDVCDAYFALCLTSQAFRNGRRKSFQDVIEARGVFLDAYEQLGTEGACDGFSFMLDALAKAEPELAALQQQDAP